MKDLVQILKAFSDPTRIRILNLLRRKELCVCEIMHVLEMEQSRISHQMNVLRGAGLAEDRREGRWSIYRIPDHARTIVEDILGGQLGRRLEASPEIEKDDHRLEECLKMDLRSTICETRGTGSERRGSRKERSPGRKRGAKAGSLPNQGESREKQEEDRTSEKKRILFICTHNSARSQMAEGLVNALYGDRLHAFSGGTEVSEVNPFAVEVMREVGIDISAHESKSVERFVYQRFDFIMTVCDRAKQNCPFFPGGKEYIHRSFEDPAACAGSDEDIRACFRRSRDEIRAWIEETLIKPLSL